jgi:hypothetical protein
MKNNYKILLASLFVVLIIGTTTSSSAFSSAYAAGENHKDNKDKVKASCNDVSITLATLYLALQDITAEGREGILEELEDELQEGEVGNSLGELIGNFQNVLDRANEQCPDDNIRGFVDFEAIDVTRP